MRIKHLFIIWTEPLNITGGGIHRCITTLMTELPARGFSVHYLYSTDNYNTFHIPLSGNKDKILNLHELRSFLIEHSCDFILGQDAIFSSILTQRIKELNIPNIKFINQYHSTLLYFEKKLTLDFLKYQWITQKQVLSRFGIALRFLFYPVWKLKVRNTQNRIYRFNYNNSDVSLLLSEYEKPILKRICQDKLFHKCFAIPNPLSWADIETPEVLQFKNNEVLIVSRLYNVEKRIDLALKAWRILQDKGKDNGWSLRIVGDGIDRPYLMKLSADLGLRNIIWTESCDPRPYYKNARIFLLTSIVEGWALTLTESMQFGVVPIAFDSYPAVKSIIQSGHDGFIIKAKDINLMAQKLEFLINNPDIMNSMAINALESCKRFEVNSIIDQWAGLLSNL